MTLRKLFASSIWFLIGAVIFLIAGIRYVVMADTVGAIINFLVALFFLIGYLGQLKFNKPKRK